MQKLLVATAIAVSTSFASFAALAAENSGSGAFAHIGMGQAHYHTGLKPLDRERVATYDLLGGYRWGLGETFALGAESGYARLGSIDHVDYAAATHVKYDLRAGAWLAGANAKWNVTRDFSLVGRAGSAWVHAHGHARSTKGNSYKAQATTTNTVAYLGLGVGYALTNHVDLTLQATRYGWRSSTRRGNNGVIVTTYNAGVEYRF